MHSDTPLVEQDKVSYRVSRQQFIAWLTLSSVMGVVVILYVALSLSVSADPLLMPLDDTYIHFQYARQFAQGDPMVYNPGDDPTSGATSLLYSPLLGIGYWLGFTGWSMAYWALGIGVLCFFGATWLVYLIARDNPLTNKDIDQPDVALWIALAFAVSGPFVWAALSGMETALFVFTVLLTLYAVQQNRLWLTILAAVIMTLTRPEGLILAGVSMLALAFRSPWPIGQPGRVRRIAWLAIPLLAGLVQPVINVLATGSATSSGMLAKSHLYNAGAPVGDRVRDILEFFGRMWSELLRGYSADWGAFTSPVLAGLALTGGIVGAWVAWHQRRVNVAVVVLVWIVVLTAAVATLDTAFWQFKRYQLPVMALFFPAAAWVLGALDGASAQASKPRVWIVWGLILAILLPSIITTITFARNYVENVTVVRDQQVPMARWVSANLPDDARIGVHDVGLMGYFADQKLYDVVGLTTPGPARSWRQGPGAIYEHMAHSSYRPGYFAIYPDVQGLRYLVNAGVFGTVLHEFPVDLPSHNVAAALDYQAVYEADWSHTHAEERVAQTTTLDYLEQIEGLALVDQVDVANLDSEAEHDYAWSFGPTSPGYVTEVFREFYHACGLSDETRCRPADGGRVITGSESFTLNTRPDEDLLLVTRVHGGGPAVTLEVYANGQFVAQRVQPAVGGRWLEVVTLVPGDQITSNRTRIRVKPQIIDPDVDAYRPYYHWAYQGTFTPIEPVDPSPVATFGDNGAVRLLDYNVEQQEGQFAVTLTWLGPALGTGDGVVFVHLYDNINAPPVAPVEGLPEGVARPQGGVLPPGNWLLGAIRDFYSITLPDDLPPGTYQVAIGLFDSRTGMRYPASNLEADTAQVFVDADRLFIGEIKVD